jgi:large subunit ribosomal protein L31
MKNGIHPQYSNVSIKCVCGATYETRSTSDISKIDICSACHPFYTGKQKVLDTEGRIEKFQKKYGSAFSDRIKKAKKKVEK